MANPGYHWQLMGEMDKTLLEKWQSYAAAINREEVIPAKYQELIICGMAYVLKSEPATLTHTANAMEKFGASKDEIFTVLTLSLLLAGAHTYRQACLTLEEYLSDK